MKSYFKKIWKTLLVGGVCLLLVAGVFSLYDLPLEPVAYAAVLCALACLAALGYGYYRYSARRKHLSYILETLPLNLDTLPEPGRKRRPVPGNAGEAQRGAHESADAAAAFLQ